MFYFLVGQKKNDVDLHALCIYPGLAECVLRPDLRDDADRVTGEEATMEFLFLVLLCLLLVATSELIARIHGQVDSLGNGQARFSFL